MFLLLALLSLASAIVVEKFNTNQRQVYTSWSECDSCTCKYFYLYAFEQTTNPDDMSPAFYLYLGHSSYDNCLFTYNSQYLSVSTPLPGLDIARSGRSGELVATGLLDSGSNTVDIDLVWVNDPSYSSSCNCRSTYSYGIDTISGKYNSGYNEAIVTGHIKIAGVEHTVPSDAAGAIYKFGSKTITFQHN